jgi:hypothetical protein
MQMPQVCCHHCKFTKLVSCNSLKARPSPFARLAHARPRSLCCAGNGLLLCTPLLTQTPLRQKSPTRLCQTNAVPWLSCAPGGSLLRWRQRPMRQSKQHAGPSAQIIIHHRYYCWYCTPNQHWPGNTTSSKTCANNSAFRRDPQPLQPLLLEHGYSAMAAAGSQAPPRPSARAETATSTGSSTRFANRNACCIKPRRAIPHPSNSQVAGLLRSLVVAEVPARITPPPPPRPPPQSISPRQRAALQRRFHTAAASCCRLGRQLAGLHRSWQGWPQLEPPHHACHAPACARAAHRAPTHSAPSQHGRLRWAPVLGTARATGSSWSCSCRPGAHTRAAASIVQPSPWAQRRQLPPPPPPPRPARLATRAESASAPGARSSAGSAAGCRTSRL